MSEGQHYHGSGTAEEARTSYGLMAEFSTPSALVEAARQAHKAGYRRMDGYSPFPIEELQEALGFRATRLPLLVLMGGLLGGTLGYTLAYWVSAVAYPLNIGGRPLHSTPAFVPVTFEMTILFAALSAVIGMIVLNGLPMLYHPVFNVERFRTASRDKFFLVIEASDPKFDPSATREFLATLGAHEVDNIAN
jgi:hypothetical protein